MLQFPMSTFARVFLEGYSDEVAAEQMETVAAWEEELKNCVNPGQPAAKQRALLVRQH